jgi:hypothetical protein
LSAAEVPTFPPAWLGTGGPRPVVGSPQLQLAGGSQQSAAAQQITEIPQGIVPVEFGIVNVAASLAASQLYRVIPGSSVVAAQIGVLLPFRGSVVAMTLLGTENKTAGEATFVVYLDGAATSAELDWATGGPSDSATFAPGDIAFDRGEVLDIRLTTDGAFTPTTADVEVIAYLAQTQSTSGGT